MSLGLPQHRVEVHPYDPLWPELYEREATRLKEVLGDWILQIEHVGSTAIPGMDAKPIIDIGIAIADFEAAFDTVHLMAELDYVFRGEQGVPRRHFFILGRPRTHHVHMSEITGPDWIHRLAFRDYLRTHLDMAEEYRAIKARLAAEFPRDISGYSSGKDAFVQKVLDLALRA
ncbi:MAG: GrpB family protein [Armatimonadetes bacterium]|nr:GrpB family protein [Armatimonadota bacterium]